MICDLNKEKGFWLLDDPESREHRYDVKLSDALAEQFKGRSVVDLGCGFGKYVENFKNKGIICDGYDGNPYTEKITNGMCGVMDLTERHILDKDYDFVLCLEVAEHIPEKYEGAFISNLHRNNICGIIMSWGVPGQRGWGHVNCRINEYVKGVFIDLLGYTNDLEYEKKLRDVAELEWFKNTIMVFKR